MGLSADRINRRRAGVAAALAMAAALLFNLPAEAEHEACPGLQAAYISRPDARAGLLATLQAFGCTVPNTGTTTSTAPTTTTSTTSTSTSSTTTVPTSSTTSTTLDSAAGSCAALQADYLARPDVRPQLLLLLQLFGCQVPTIPSSTTSTTTAPTTTTSTSSTTTSSTTTSSTSTTTSTSTTVPPAAVCPALQEAYIESPTSRAQLLPQLLAFGCAIPAV